MPRQIEGDWCEIGIPDNAHLHETALIETSLCFEPFRSAAPDGLVMEEGAGIYTGAVLDVGPAGRVRLGRCALLTAALVICDSQITFGDHVLVSWNVVIMDSYRVPVSAAERRKVLTALAASPDRRVDTRISEPRPISIGSNAWIGFDSVILPGVSIGEGAIIGCRSVVMHDVPPYTIAGGNPARIIREVPRG
jgi:acetyltransferase-like isoleucine patch superfamily enzyme